METNDSTEVTIIILSERRYCWDVESPICVMVNKEKHSNRSHPVSCLRTDVVVKDIKSGGGSYKLKSLFLFLYSSQYTRTYPTRTVTTYCEHTQRSRHCQCMDDRLLFPLVFYQKPHSGLLFPFNKTLINWLETVKGIFTLSLCVVVNKSTVFNKSEGTERSRICTY